MGRKGWKNYFNFLKNSKGLSEVVTTLIIILLVLVAIGIVWVVVNNILQSGAEQAEIERFTLDLDIKSVKIQENNVTVVVVKRNPGEGDFVGLNFVFSDGKNSEIIRQNASLKELDTKSFTFTLTEINPLNLKTVSIVPIFKLSSGKEALGIITDIFDVSSGSSIGGTGAVVHESNFAKLGFVGTGEYTASISANPEISPEFKTVTINPLDVRVGENQILTAVVYSINGITNVTTTTQLDNGTLNLNLVKASDDGTTSIWNVSWIVYDTHIDTYRTTFIATDGQGNKNNVTLTWTDACTDQFVHGSASSIATDCNVNIISGADTSNISVANGVTLTLSASGVVAYTPGNSITKAGTGKIAMAGGQITKQYLFYYDADNDRASSNTTMFLSTVSTNTSGIVRGLYKLGAAGVSDCDPNNAALWQILTLYPDNDDDGQAGTASAQVCSGSSPPPGYFLNAGGDCYDYNAEVYLGRAAAYFYSDRGDGSFDYNCDGSINKLYTGAVHAWPGVSYAGYCFYSSYSTSVTMTDSLGRCIGSGSDGYYVDGSNCGENQNDLECGTSFYGGTPFFNCDASGCYHWYTGSPECANNVWKSSESESTQGCY